MNTRTEKLIGATAVEKLNKASVIVFGVGGVGSYAVEAIARAGVGSITVVDSDVVSVSNINRQLIALNSTVGRKKTEVVAQRIRDINPDATVVKKDMFFDSTNSDEIDFSTYDYVLDCIDSVQSKIEIIVKANEAGTKVISCMGTGNKLNPEMFEFADISETQYCPLARAVRTRLKKVGIEKLDVVYSKESPVSVTGEPASISFVPSVAGLMMASKVIKELIK